MKLSKKQQQWNATMADMLERLDSSFAGRIPWDAAAHHFNTGKSPGEAAMIIAQSEEPRGLPFPSGARVVKDGQW